MRKLSDVISGSHRGAVAHAERVHSGRVGQVREGDEKVGSEGEDSTGKSIPNSELWRTVLGGPVHGALNLGCTSPLSRPGESIGTGLSDLG